MIWWHFFRILRWNRNIKENSLKELPNHKIILFANLSQILIAEIVETSFGLTYYIIDFSGAYLLHQTDTKSYSQNDSGLFQSLQGEFPKSTPLTVWYQTICSCGTFMK